MKELKKYSDIQTLSIYELEDLLREYPWFSFARDILLCKLAMLGREYFESGVRTSVTLITARESLYKKVSKIYNGEFVPDTFPLESVSANEKQDANTDNDIDNADAVRGEDTADFDCIKEEAQKIITDESANRHIKNAKQQYYPGGDYFSKEDFDEISKTSCDRFGDIKLAPVSSSDEEGCFENNEDETYGGDVFDSSRFYTETLANIYVEQSYYDKALEVYEKLILLYPEKSTYFASLIREIKLKK